MNELEQISDEYDKLGQDMRTKFPEIAFDADDIDSPYVAATEFIQYLISEAEKENFVAVKKCLSYVEELHRSRSGKVREFATIGILEGIQNRCGLERIEKLKLEDHLGEESTKWWNQLNKFWNGEVRYVGETYNKND